MYEVPRYGYKIGVRLLFGPMKTKESDGENGLDQDCVRIGVWDWDWNWNWTGIENWGIRDFGVARGKEKKYLGTDRYRYVDWYRDGGDTLELP